MTVRTHTLVLIAMLAAASTGCGEDALFGAEPFDFGADERDASSTTPVDPPEEPIMVPPKPEPEPEPEPGFSERFVGDWVVHDNVARGGITADIYRFHEDGRLERLMRYDPASIAVRCEDPDPMTCNRWGEEVLTCDFGGRWESVGETTLRIEGACSDEVSRQLVFEVPARDPDTEEDAPWPGIRLELVSVGDESVDPLWALSFVGPAASLFFDRCDGSGLCMTP